MKGAFLILAGGILFTGVFLGGVLTGGCLVYAMEHDEEYQAKKRAKRPESDIPEETAE